MPKKVFFTDRAFEAIKAETKSKYEKETGGVFLGYREDPGTWYVMETIGPGPNSIHQHVYFEYDEEYVNQEMNFINKLFYNNSLDLVGLWHRHPGSLDTFSSTDAGTNSEFAQLDAEGAISALVNVDPKFRLTMYAVTLPLQYEKIEFEVGDKWIPDNLNIPKRQRGKIKRKKFLKKLAAPAVILAVAALAAVLGVTFLGPVFSGAQRSTSTPIITSINIEPPSLVIDYNDTTILTAIVDPSAITDVKWESKDGKIAFVTKSGMVRASGIGNTTVTASSGGITAFCEITVRPKIKLTGNNTITMGLGTETSLTAEVTPNGDVMWESEYPHVADVKVTNGKQTAVIPKAPGITTITAKEKDGATASCEVTVVSIEIEDTERLLALGTKKALTAKVLPRGINSKMTWSSDRSAVATVDENGMVTARAEGTANITVSATVNKVQLTATCEITVTAPLTPTSIEE